jgi:hypothetical protein
VRDHNIAEMTAALEMSVRFLCLSKRECRVNHGTRLVQSDGAVHFLEIGATADASEMGAQVALASVREQVEV